MQVNSAYLNNHIPEIIDNEKPLVVTSCGNYRMKTRDVFETRRDKGRKDYQLLYIASGKSHFFIDGKEHIVTAGHMVIFHPDEPQHYKYYKEDRTSVYWVHFTGSQVEKILEHYNIIRGEKIIYSGTSPDFQWLFGQIIQELQLCRKQYDEMLTLLLRNIFILIRRSLEINKNFTDTMEKEVSYAIYYFRDNFNKEINVDEYAQSLNISVSWFIRCFRQITGMTPLQYVINLRISNAQMLLETSDYTISQIAESVGYENALYFSRLFHKQTGISPKEYRKKSKQ
ncbi:MAG: helix-turn-helix domain-containing protein [Oscillospiraceae bacterium]